MQLLPEPEAHGRRGYNHAMARSRLLLGALLVACALFAVWQDAAVGQGRAPVTAVASPDGKLVLSSLGSAVPKLTDPTIGATRPCGFRHSGVSYDHVMWVFMENESLSSIIGAPDAPFANLLARRCGLATDYYAVGHPSLSNYLAATGGTTAGVSDDGEPAAHPVSGQSIFSQVDSHHLTWRSYAESMPVDCDTVTSGDYAARHNPAVYYTALRKACARYDVPMGPISTGALHQALYTGSLANFVFVTPNICDDAHSCPVLHGDEWLARFMSMVFASSTYRRGHMVVFVVWDEGNLTNQVPAMVAAPSVPSGIRSSVPFNHYSLLQTAEQLLGLPLLDNSRTAQSMVAAFHL